MKLLRSVLFVVVGLGLSACCEAKQTFITLGTPEFQVLEEKIMYVACVDETVNLAISNMFYVASGSSEDAKGYEAIVQEDRASYWKCVGHYLIDNNIKVVWV